MLLYWIWFAQCGKVSAHTKQALLQHFHDPEDIYFAQEQALWEFPGLTRDGLDELTDKDLSQAQKILDTCKRKGIHILTCNDGNYPQRLRNIYDPPVILYYKGILPDWEAQPVIGIVGTRRATTYGLSTARRFGGQISVCGAVVASGAASGIDAQAMEGALDAGGAVIGVLGCGVDIVYPPKNRSLFSRMEAEGCLLSEYAPGEQPLGWHFPQRNRIITGISNGLLVVEAPERSGALISADHAMEQGREVFVVPGNVDVPDCAGSNRLLEDGAIPALSGWHVMREYEALFPGKVVKRDLPGIPQRQTAQVAQRGQIPEVAREENPAADKKSIDKDEKSTYSVVNNPITALDPQEQQVLAQIERTPKLVDEVIAAVQLSAGTVKSILTKLTIKGLVRMLPGGRVSLK